jgi:beta-galactosidase
MANGLLAGLAALAIVWGMQSGPAEAQAEAVAGVSATQPRAVTALDLRDWKFVQDDSLTDAAALSSDASTWSTVHLPHTWNAIDAATTEQTSPTSKNYKRGKGWYRLEFDSPGTGATQWLQFDGASIVADVWLNGQKLGQHKGAFTAFRFDVTGKLLSGQKNVLLVKTDNSAPLANSDLTAIAPLSGDFNMSGGLYRGCRSSPRGMRPTLRSTISAVPASLPAPPRSAAATRPSMCAPS